jgi:hypothetical protein
VNKGLWICQWPTLPPTGIFSSMLDSYNTHMHLFGKGGERGVRRIIVLVTVALIMASLVALSASSAFAQPLLPAAADCGVSSAERHAPNQADPHIPEAEPATECRAAGGPPKK